MKRTRFSPWAATLISKTSEIKIEEPSARERYPMGVRRKAATFMALLDQGVAARREPGPDCGCLVLGPKGQRE